MWQGLRAAGFPVSFKRQVVLCDRFIVDLFAPSVGLVLEVDGPLHEHTRTADARRDRVLRRAGYTVLRFTADEVMHALPRVVDRIRVAVTGSSSLT